MVLSPSQQVFLLLLSNARHGTDRAARFYEEISHYAPQADMKATLQARAFIANKTLVTLDECFRLMEIQPIKVRGRVEEVFADDFRRDLIELQSPIATALYIMAKVIHLHNLRTAEYLALSAAADVVGHSELGTLLESCLPDHLVFIERARRMIRDTLTERMSGRLVA